MRNPTLFGLTCTFIVLVFGETILDLFLVLKPSHILQTICMQGIVITHDKLQCIGGGEGVGGNGKNSLSCPFSPSPLIYYMRREVQRRQLHEFVGGLCRGDGENSLSCPFCPSPLIYHMRREGQRRQLHELEGGCCATTIGKTHWVIPFAPHTMETTH